MQYILSVLGIESFDKAAITEQLIDHYFLSHLNNDLAEREGQNNPYYVLKLFQSHSE